ncbi:MAG: tetratricopeptide repeat protein [Rhodospirillales bacterium]
MSALLDAAYAHHRAGRLAEAEAGYRRALAIDAENPDALYLLGTVKLQLGQAVEALPLLERSVRRRGKNPHARAALGTALLECGRVEEAIRAFRRALDIEPRHADALHNMGNALAGLGRHGEARRAFERLVALHPDHPGALNNLALCLIAERQYAPAIEHLRRAVAIAPNYPNGYCNLGLALLESGQVDEAAAALRRSLAIQPDDAMSHAFLGTALEQRGEIEAAERHCRRALALQPGLPEGLVGLGLVERRRQRFAEAAALFAEAAERRPGFVAAIDNLGNALNCLGRTDEAVAVYEGALLLAPRHAGVLGNLGHALKNGGRLDAAIARFDAALAVDPSHADARMGRALACLLQGRWGDGFRDYRAREAMAATGHLYHREPLPADLADCHVWVVRDQGLGDELFFLRFAAGLRARGARLTYAGDPRLAAMIARAGIVDAVAPPDAAPDADFVVAVGDLPCLLGMDDGDAPPSSLRIDPLPGALQDAAARLAALGPPPYLALTWRAGTPGTDRALFKELPLESLAAALPPSATLVAVQRLPADGEIDRLSALAGRPVHDLAALNGDLEAMLALMAVADRYVAVSNTNVHLRTAAGRATHVLVPNPPEFRWMAAGEVSPWFPGCRLYRQGPEGSWIAAGAALAGDLAG